MKVKDLIQKLSELPEELDVFVFMGGQAESPTNPSVVYVEYENYDKNCIDDCWFDSVKEAIEEGVEFEDLIKCVIM